MKSMSWVSMRRLIIVLHERGERERERRERDLKSHNKLYLPN